MLSAAKKSEEMCSAVKEGATPQRKRLKKFYVPDNVNKTDTSSIYETPIKSVLSAVEIMLEEIEMSYEHTKEEIDTDSQEYEKMFIEKFGTAAKEEIVETQRRPGKRWPRPAPKPVQPVKQKRIKHLNHIKEYDYRIIRRPDFNIKVVIHAKNKVIRSEEALRTLVEHRATAVKTSAKKEIESDVDEEPRVYVKQGSKKPPNKQLTIECVLIKTKKAAEYAILNSPTTKILKKENQKAADKLFAEEAALELGCYGFTTRYRGGKKQTSRLVSELREYI
jgi:hypothetical protein